MIRRLSTEICVRTAYRYCARLIAAFIIATLMPLGATIWITTSLLERSLGYATTEELDRLSRTLEGTVQAVLPAGARLAQARTPSTAAFAPPSYAGADRSRVAGGCSRLLGERRAGTFQPVGPRRRSSGLHAQAGAGVDGIPSGPRRDPDAGAVGGIPPDSRAGRVDRVARSAARIHADAAAAGGASSGSSRWRRCCSSRTASAARSASSRRA